MAGDEVTDPTSRGAPSEYWRICVEEGLDRAGIIASSEQVTALARSMESAADMQGESTGRHFIPHPAETELRDVKRRYEAEVTAAKKLLRNAEDLAIRLAGRRRWECYVEHNRTGATIREEMR